jgi:hypothetical protein
MTDARDGGAIQEPQAKGNGSRAGFYDETEVREHEGGKNSDSHTHVYSPEVSICNIYFSLDKTT